MLIFCTFLTDERQRGAGVLVHAVLIQVHTFHANWQYHHKNCPRCHKFIPLWGQLKTLSVVVKM